MKETDTNSHYCLTQVQPIEYIQDILRNFNGTPFQAACLKDIIKYLSRYGNKDDKIKEAQKIFDYSLWFLMDALHMKVNPTIHNHEYILGVLQTLNEAKQKDK